MSRPPYRFVIGDVGARPPFGEVVDHLYGVGSDVDTDGDSSTASATDWTWLYMCKRPMEDSPVVEATLADDRNNVMIVTSDDMRLANLAADYLAMRSGGKIEICP